MENALDFVPWGRTKASLGWAIQPNGCHIWTGSRNNNGYAQANVAGRRVLVHRWRYESEVGPIPPGLVLDHFACDNGRGGCVNPLHCRPVTQRENTLRSPSMAAIHAARTHCNAGHPLTTDNLLACEARKGSRVCKTCHSDGARRTYERRAAAVGRSTPYRHGSNLCRAGLHELAGDNLMPCEARLGKRTCRACFNDRQRERHRNHVRTETGRDGYVIGSERCRSGRHILTPENLVASRARSGVRTCRACVNERRKEYRREKQGAA